MAEWIATNRVRPGIDPYASVNVLGEEEDGFWFNRNRVAVKSWKSATRWYNDRTDVEPCDLCGRLGTRRRVCHRSDCFSWDLWRGTPLLCMGCWNKVRPFVRRHEELRSLRAIARRIQRGDFRDGQQDDSRSA